MAEPVTKTGAWILPDKLWVRMEKLLPQYQPGLLFYQEYIEERPIASIPVFRRLKDPFLRTEHDMQWVKLRITFSILNSIAAPKSKALIIA